MSEPVKAILNLPDVKGEQTLQSIQAALGGLPSVQNIEVNVETRQVAFEYDPDQVRMITIEQKLDDAGFGISPDLRPRL